MNVRDICTRRVVTIAQGEDLSAAAALMKDKRIGYLVVTMQNADMQIPIGVLTDRDIVTRVISEGVDARTITVADVMTREPRGISEDADLDAALEQMRWLGVRRLPVIGAKRELTGVLSIDEVAEHLVAEVANVAAALRGRKAPEKRARR